MGLASSHTCSYGAAPGGLLIAACDPNTCGGPPQGGSLGPGEEGGLGPKCEEDPGREPASPTCVVEQPLEPGRPLHLGSAHGQDGGHTRTGPQNPGGGMKDPPPPRPPGGRSCSLTAPRSLCGHVWAELPSVRAVTPGSLRPSPLQPWGLRSGLRPLESPVGAWRLGAQSRPSPGDGPAPLPWGDVPGLQFPLQTHTSRENLPCVLNQLGVSIVVQQKQIWLASTRTQGRSQASLSGLKIPCCHELWCRSQMQLQSGVAVAVV